MFIKSYEKDNKTYYILVVVDQVKDSDKPHFINTFIPEKLALMLNKCDVEIRVNGKKVDK